MKLELKHLAPYLPYGLKVRRDYELMSPPPTKHSVMLTVQGIHDDGILTTLEFGAVKFSECKPILRPLSDLTKEIEHNGEKFVPFEKVGIWEGKRPLKHTGRILCWPYEAIEDLISWHFDVFNLIENNLAIDINTIK